VDERVVSSDVVRGDLRSLRTTLLDTQHVFHAYINEMHVQEAKFPVKNIVRQRCVEGYNSGVKGLITVVINFVTW
jgi:hypothetical protein